MTDEDLQKIEEAEALHKAATEGPWAGWDSWGEPKGPVYANRIGPPEGGGLYASGREADIEASEEDFEFVIRARTLMPELCRIAREARDSAERLAAVVDTLDGEHDAEWAEDGCITCRMLANLQPGDLGETSDEDA